MSDSPSLCGHASRAPRHDGAHLSERRYSTPRGAQSRGWWP